MQQDPKNEHRIGELDACIEELRDFFLGDNEYHTSEETLIRYYDAFLYQADWQHNGKRKGAVALTENNR